MPFSVKISANTKQPQHVPGLGLLTPGEVYHVTDAEADRFEAVQGVALDKVEAFDTSSIKSVDPTKSPRYKPAAKAEQEPAPKTDSEKDKKEGDS